MPERTEPLTVREGEEHTFSEGDVFTYKGVRWRVIRARNGKLRIVAVPQKCLTGTSQKPYAGHRKTEPAP